MSKKEKSKLLRNSTNLDNRQPSRRSQRNALSKKSKTNLNKFLLTILKT